MTLGLSQEQPPFSIEGDGYEELRDYLIRRFVDVDTALKQSSKFPERKEMPYKPQVGDVHYFGDPVTHNYDAAILVEGYWGLSSTGWNRLDGVTAASGTVQLNWKFSTATGGGDPGSKTFAYNNSNPTLVTEIYINDTTNSNADASAILNALNAGDKIYIQQIDTAINNALYTVVSVLDNTGWFTITVTHDASGTLPGNNKDCGFLMIFSAPGGVTDHGALTGLVPDDDHTQYALLTGRPGGQTLFGGTVSGDDIDIAGSVGPNPGFINLNSPVIFGPYTANPAAAYGFDYSVTDNPTGAFIGGGLNFSGNITTAHSTFIYESFRGAPTITTGATPGFSAYTVLQALPRLVAGSVAGYNPLAPLIINAGAQIANPFSGTRSVTNVVGMNFGCQLRGEASGATMNCTSWIGLQVLPAWHTVTGSTVSFGTIIGMDVRAPAPALFAQNNGTERMAAFYGMQVANPGINNGFGTAPVAAIRSAVNFGTNRYFLLNAGTAPSDMGAAHMYFDDNFGVAYGGSGITNFDYWESWNGAGGYQRHFFVANADEYHVSNAVNQQILHDYGANEFTFNTTRGFSFGAQTGTNGNQFGNFVFGASTTPIPGEYSQFILTQAGNLTVDNANMNIFAWTINAQTMTLSGAGTVNEAAVLNIGGNPNQGSVGRYGVRILSNPSGATDNYPLWIPNGTSRINGLIAGDPGTEAAGITISGTTYDSALKASAIGGSDEAQFIMHRHSTTLGAVIVGARSNSNDDTHSIVLDDQDLLALIGVGWDGSEYEIGAVMRFSVDGTPGANDMPGRVDFLTTPDGSVTPALALRINAAQHCDFQTNQALGGGATATLGAIGGSGPTAAAQATWLEIEIGGVVHWVPAWT